MNEHFRMLADAGTAVVNHWPDIVTDSLLAIVAWLVKHGISDMDKRHERAEDHLEKQSERLADHETRISLIERERERGSS